MARTYVYGEIHGADVVGQLKAKGFEVHGWRDWQVSKVLNGLFHKEGFTGFHLDPDDPDVLTGISGNTGDDHTCNGYYDLVEMLKSGEIDLVGVDTWSQCDEYGEDTHHIYCDGSWHQPFEPQGFMISDDYRDEATKAINDALAPFRVGSHGCDFAWPEPEPEPQTKPLVGTNGNGDKLAVTIPLDPECETIRDLEHFQEPFEALWHWSDSTLHAVDIVDLFIKVGRKADRELEDVYTLSGLVNELRVVLAETKEAK